MSDAPPGNHCSGPGLWIWLLISCLWIGAVSWFAQQGWPRMSLDLPARDPQVQAALARAVQAHLLKHGALALAPPLLIGIVLWRRRRR